MDKNKHNNILYEQKKMMKIKVEYRNFINIIIKP